MEQEIEKGCYSTLEPKRSAVTAGGLDWSYLEWAPASPKATLLLLHGITSTAFSWWRVGPALAERGFRVISPDMPGHGNTGPMPTDYSIPHTAEALAAFGKTFGLDELLLAGHSWGGANALEMAARQLLPFSRVVLIDPALRLGDRESVARTALSYTELVGKPATANFDTVRAAYSTWSECDVYWRAQALEKAQLGAVEGFFADNTNLNLVEHFRRVAVPLFLLLGDPKVGGVVAPSVQAKAKERLKPGQDKFELLEGVGHNLHRETYDRFMAAFVPFLEG